MARVRHLRNAPITEAIVDFRVSLPSDARADRLLDARDRLRAEYPRVIERKGFETRVEMTRGQPQQAHTRDLGFRGIWLKTEDQRTVAQYRVDGFTFNRLKPYTRWDGIRREALRLWAIYVELIRPSSVTRVALRYINHMNLPGPVDQLDKYVLTGPRLPQSVPQTFSGFATRVVLEHPSPGMTANVAQTLEVGVETAAPSLLFDIDAYRVGHFGVQVSEMKDVLGDLHGYKNEIFFGSLTDRFLEVFE